LLANNLRLLHSAEGDGLAEVVLLLDDESSVLDEVVMASEVLGVVDMVSGVVLWLYVFDETVLWL
jgi:hypothetical protein